MNLKINRSTKSFFKLIIIGCLTVFLLIPQTNAYFSDVELSEDNLFTASTLDLEFDSNTTDFTPIDIIPNTIATRSAKIRNVGVLPFKYSQEYVYASGSATLCNTLDLKAYYNWYDNSGVLHQDLKYDDKLSSFSLNTSGTDTDMVNPNSYGYYSNTDYTATEHWYTYEISLPTSADPSLGHQTCEFDIQAKAWQIDLTYGQGFNDIETLSNTITTGTWARVAGLKYNDLNGNGSQDTGEPALSGWTIFAGQQVDHFQVDSNTATPHTSVILDNGQKYFVQVNGTFYAGDNITADAKYSVRIPNATWTDEVQHYEAYGPTLLDLQIDGVSPDWGHYNGDHRYWLTITGDGSTKDFSIYDIYYPNNIGSLDVTIYRVVAEDITDSNGEYTLDITGITGDLTIAEQSQTDWVQSAPNSGSYTVTAPVDVSGRDFGNRYIDPNDTTAPTSSLTVSSSPTRDIDNRVTNGGFENDLNGWTAVGDIYVVGAENGVTPIETKMLRIGNDNSDSMVDGNSVDVNFLYQTNPNNGNGLRSFGFWYNFATYEDGSGFDEPGFIVYAGDKVVHQVWADDVQTDYDETTLETTGWKFLTIDLTYVDDPDITLAFYAGNTGDLTHQSFVYIDGVTTNVATVNNNAQFEVSTTAGDYVAYSYKVGGVETSGSGLSPLTFSIPGTLDSNTIEYWAYDLAGNVETHHKTKVHYDNIAPEPIDDLVVSDSLDGDFSLMWTAVSDDNPFGVDQAGEYDLRYSTAPISTTISDTDWDNLPKPMVRNLDGLPGSSLRSPLQAGNIESYDVHVDDGANDYYFAVRVRDRAGNMSNLVIGSIANDGSVSNTETYMVGDVVINEIMWMGSDGHTADEWIELRNMTDQDIDMNGWEVAGLGAGSNSIIITGSIPANGFYVIANYSEMDGNSGLLHAPNQVDTSLSLVNTGEQLTLYTDTALIMDQTPIGIWTAGENGTDLRSMERNNDIGDGTDPLNWHTCDSDSCGDARVLYWDVVGHNYGTPGGDNLSFTEDQIVPKLTLSKANKNNKEYLQFNLTGIEQYVKANYQIIFTHGDNISEGIESHFDIDPNTREYKSQEFYLGTCSSEGKVCINYENISDISAVVTLTKEDGQTIELNKLLE